MPIQYIVQIKKNKCKVDHFLNRHVTSRKGVCKIIITEAHVINVGVFLMTQKSGDLNIFH